MASNNLGRGPIQCLNTQVKYLQGSFETNGSGAPLNVLGLGFDVVRSSAGKYTISFDDTFNRLLGASCTLQQNSPTAAVQSSLTIGATTHAVVYTAISPFIGSIGNAITITHLGGATQTLAVSVTGLSIVVQLGTNSGSVVTSLASAVVALVNADPVASLFVVASDLSGGGSIAVVQAITHLSGGAGSLRAALGPVDVVSAGTAVIQIQDCATGTATDLAANANNRVNFNFAVQNSFFQ